MITDGSVYFGANADAGNTDETAKFPSAVALIWRWTGDDAFRDEMYAVREVEPRVHLPRARRRRATAGPRAWATSSARAWARRSSTTRPPRCAGCATSRTSRAPRATPRRATWAGDKAAGLEARFEDDWWMPRDARSTPTRSATGNEKIQQRHWIGVTPMEIETVRDGRAVPGLTTKAQRRPALDLRETSLLRRRLRALPHRRAGLRPGAESDRPGGAHDVHAQHVDHGGRRGQLRPPRPAASSSASPPPTGGCSCPTFDEQPGAMPEIAPSPDYSPTGSIDQQFTERAMVLQAWGNYGTAWPVVHQQLGVRPDAGRGRLEVVPQVPDGQPRVAGSAIRLGERGRRRGRGLADGQGVPHAGQGRRADRRSSRSATRSRRARRSPPRSSTAAA